MPALGPFLAWLIGNLPMIFKVLRELHADDSMEDSKTDNALTDRLRERLRTVGVYKSDIK